MYTHSLANKGSLNRGGWKPGRNIPLYSVLSTNVCVVSPYCSKHKSIFQDILNSFHNVLNRNSDCNAQCKFIGFILSDFSYRLKHGQPNFTKLVLQGVGLFYNDCTSLAGFL